MRPIIPDRLWLGTARDARDLRQVHEHGIVAIVDLAVEEPPAQLSRDLIYCRFPLDDGDANPRELVTLAISTTAHLIRANLRTLIACSGGMSRSPAIAAVALSIVRGGEPDRWLADILASGPRQVSPAFWNSLLRALPLTTPAP